MSKKIALKTLVNEDTLLRTRADTLLPMMFLGLRKLGNICCGHKICVRNKCCALGKRGNICVGNNVSATMCPLLPGPLR